MHDENTTTEKSNLQTSAFTRKQTAFEGRLMAYRLARAKFDMHCAMDYRPEEEPEGHQEEMNRLSDLHTDAMDILLLTPAMSRVQMAQKLEIIVREKVYDNWHLCDEIMAILGCDGERLL